MNAAGLEETGEAASPRGGPVPAMLRSGRCPGRTGIACFRAGVAGSLKLQAVN
jgi:hypothetical protein